VVAAAVETPPAHDAGAQAQDAGASAPAQSAAASTPAETAEGKDDAAAPAGQSAPTVEPGEPVTEQPASPEPTGPQPPAGSSPDEPAEAAPEEVAAATPPEQEKQHEPAAQAPRLSGHIQGEIPAGLHVLLYGPDNVLRLAGRAPVAPEGVWQIPIPPAGRYRLVVSAGAERHLFVSPEYRTIVITGSGEPMNDIDFEIRGSLQ
jgi:hypothetical protein